MANELSQSLSIPKISDVFLGIKILESHTVPDGVEAVRLSDYAGGIFMAIPSRKGMKKAIKRNAVLIDGVEANTASHVNSGQRIDLLETESVSKKAIDLKLTIRYEDDFLAVIEKPAGVVVSGNKHFTIQNALEQNLTPSTAADALPIPRPVHRLDAATSGLLIIAKSYNAMIQLGKQFEESTIEKRYRALVVGETLENGTIETPVDGKAAFTTFKVLETISSTLFGNLMLLDLRPKTGRKHQLRVHLSSLDRPILGDRLYASEKNLLHGKGLFLAAVQLVFKHPETNAELDISMQMPPKFSSMLEGARKRSEPKS